MPVTIGAKESTFADPLGLLADCHRRIERFLGVLRAVAERNSTGSLSPEHAHALEAALNYFRDAAPKHHADEEQDLFPQLRALDSPEAEALLRRMAELEEQHRAAASCHAELDSLGRRWLDANHLSEPDGSRFKELVATLDNLYPSHIAHEESEVFPFARAALSESAKHTLGRRMAERRGAPFEAAWRGES
jgi:hemerythrin-like domain-containing protein